MAKEFVKLWLSYESYFESYSAAEVGRLVLAMIKYKSSGAAPEFSGSEKFIWPVIKRDIDTDNEFAETKRKNAKNQAEQDVAKSSKVEQDAARLSKTQQNRARLSKIEQDSQDKDKDNNPLTPLKGEEGKCNRSCFIPPTPEEVNAYCKKRNNGIDGTEFVDFYTSKGWMVGKNKMKDWQAAVRTWERSSNRTDPPPERKWID